LREQVSGAQLVMNRENLGFGTACNQGARLATADSIVFLNSDAFVEPGWLSPMLETLSLPAAGAVSAQQRHPDGRLLEAGALLDPEGFGVAYGNTHPTERYRFRFRRTVDYASGAVLAVRRRVFMEHGGFDPVFGLAYCEDADLSLRLRASGWSSYYEPRAVATHLQGTSSPPEHIRVLLEQNTAILRERWHRVLAARPRLSDLMRYPHRTIESRDACAPDRLLMLCDVLPDPDSPAGQFLTDVATARPDARLAVCTPEPVPDGPGVDRWCRLGVEIADDPDGPHIWLRDHMGSFGSIVPVDSAASEALGPRTRMTQPQAEWLDPELMTQGRALLPRLGWAPPARDPAPGHVAEVPPSRIRPPG